MCAAVTPRRGVASMRCTCLGRRLYLYSDGYLTEIYRRPVPLALAVAVRFIVYRMAITLAQRYCKSSVRFESAR
jgi:hypothetical protein